MCGIAGVLQYKSSVPRELRLRAIRLLFSHLMILTEERGKDATGVFQLHEDGDWAALKKGQKVSEFLFAETGTKDPFVYEDLMSSLLGHKREMTALVGHCRAKSIGTEYNNANNHPVIIQLDERNALLGVHNGTLKNHDIIFRKLNTDIERMGEVDSEAIFHMLYQQTDKGVLPMKDDTLRWVSERLDGTYAVVAANSRFPHRVATFREGKPLEFMAIAPLNIILVSSETKFIQSALVSYNITRQTLDKELPKLTTDSRALLEKDFRIFDLERPFPERFNYQDWDRISAGHGDLGSLAKIKEWVGATYTSSYTGSGTNYGVGTGAGTTNHLPALTGGSAHNPGGVKTSKIPGLDIVDVEAEVGPAGIVLKAEEEIRKAYTKATSVALCGEFTTEAELGSAIGKDVTLIPSMSPITIANAVQQLGFSMGYAAALADRKTETGKVREDARLLTSKIDEAVSKKKKAEEHIWALRVIAQSMLAAQESRSRITPETIAYILKGFPKLEESRKEAILALATSLLNSDDTKEMVASVKARIEGWRKSREAGKTE